MFVLFGQIWQKTLLWTENPQKERSNSHLCRKAYFSPDQQWETYLTLMCCLCPTFTCERCDSFKWVTHFLWGHTFRPNPIFTPKPGTAV